MKQKAFQLAMTTLALSLILAACSSADSDPDMANPQENSSVEVESVTAGDENTAEDADQAEESGAADPDEAVEEDSNQE